jgi:hypothetical protein
MPAGIADGTRDLARASDATEQLAIDIQEALRLNVVALAVGGICRVGI